MSDCCNTEKEKNACSCEENSDNCDCHSSHGNNCGCGGEVKAKRKGYDAIKLSLSFLSLLAAFLLGLENFHVYESVPAFVRLFSPAWIAIIWCGYPIFFSALKNFKRKKITSGLLISVAIIASIILEFLSVFGMTKSGHSHGYLFAAGEVAFLMTIGQLIESYTVNRTKKGIEKLIDLAPKTAQMKIGNSVFEVDVKALKIHDTVVVRPLEAVSVDGKVTFGKSSVNEATITGESVPRDVNIGDEVFAGTLNCSNLIEIEVEKLASDTTVSKLIRLVKEAEKKRAPIARLADKFASVIVPLAIISAFLVFIISAFGFNLPYSDAVIRGVTVLVVFCPCSLALATPTAIAAGLGNASGRGILVKSGKALETLSKIKKLAVDKTGTLTEGKISVDYFESYNMDKYEMMNLAANAEKYSTHPIAQAISKIRTSELSTGASEELVGTGVKTEVEGKIVEVVKWSEMEKGRSLADEYLSKGKTVVGIKIDKEEEGFIVLSDTLRAEAKKTVEKLNGFGIETVMLTGDNENTAMAIAKEAGISNVAYSLLPDKKLAYIEELKKEGAVAMIGDGANDAPALAASDVGIAMGAMGNDIAIETADISLMENNLIKICETIELSKRVMFKIKANIAFSMTINLLSLILSLFGILNPVTGALVHSCSSILVCLNSALLLKTRSEKKNK